MVVFVSVSSAETPDMDQQRELWNEKGPSLLSSEMVFLERIRSQFAETSSLLHPGNGEPVSIENQWALLQEESERKEIQRHPAFPLAGKSVLDAIPNNRRLVYMLKVPKKVVDDKTVNLTIEAQFWCRWERLFEGGDVDEPISRDDLAERILRRVKYARDKKKNIMLALYSPSGWQSDAIDYIAPTGEGSTERFVSPNLSVILLAPTSPGCWYDRTDRRAAFCVPLVQAELPRDVRRRCRSAIQEELLGVSYVTFDGLCSRLPFSREIIQASMRGTSRERM